MARRPTLVRYWFGMPLLGGVLFAGGCSAAKPPTAALAQADMAVRQASDSKAPQYAPAELRSAREKLITAQQAAVEDEYTRARRLAEQATVDAQLAQAKGSAAEAQHDATELSRTVDALKAEAERPVLP